MVERKAFAVVAVFVTDDTLFVRYFIKLGARGTLLTMVNWLIRLRYFATFVQIPFGLSRRNRLFNAVVLQGQGV